MQKQHLVIAFVILLLSGVRLFAQESVDCDAVVEIWQIQGAADAPNCPRKQVITENNIVTAVGALGFFMQTPAERSDGDPATSDGIYVQLNYPTARLGVQAGDVVNVTGRVEEIYTMTQLTARPNRVEIISSGNPVPDPIDLSTITAFDWTPGVEVHPLERYEGMYVQLVEWPVTAPTNQYDEFGVVLTSGRSFREPGIEADNTPQFVGLGLPEWDLNPELIEVDPPEMGLPAEQVTVGSRVTATGGIGYTYNDYQLWPDSIAIDLADVAPVPVRGREAGEFIIATQNVENLYDPIDDPGYDDNTYEDYVPDTQAEYAVRLGKVSEQIRVLLGAPDILAIQEIENERVVNDLIARIQTDDPALVYTGCIFEGHDPRSIDNAFLIRVDTVHVIACYQMPGAMEATVPTGQGELHDRPPLVLDAELITASGAFPITVINVHNRSLSSADTNRVQQKRMAQAVTIAEYVQERINENPNLYLAVIGDFNAFQFSDGLVDPVGIIAGTHDPAEALVAPEADTLEPNLVHQSDRLPPEERYSYIYNGSLQILDHILTTPALDVIITGAQYSRGNADGLTVWYADPAMGALRSSDHDGMVIYVRPE